MSETQNTEAGSVSGETKLTRAEKDAKFIRAWQSSNSVAEACEKTGLKTAGQKAMALRKRGVALKKMPRGGGARITEAANKKLANVLAEVNAELGLGEDGKPAAE